MLCCLDVMGRQKRRRTTRGEDGWTTYTVGSGNAGAPRGKQQQLQQQRSALAGPDQHDWRYGGCGFDNWSKRDRCLQCSQPRPLQRPPASPGKGKGKGKPPAGPGGSPAAATSAAADGPKITKDPAAAAATTPPEKSRVDNLAAQLAAVRGLIALCPEGGQMYVLQKGVEAELQLQLEKARTLWHASKDPQKRKSELEAQISEVSKKVDANSLRLEEARKQMEELTAIVDRQSSRMAALRDELEVLQLGGGDVSGDEDAEVLALERRLEHLRGRRARTDFSNGGAADCSASGARDSRSAEYSAGQHLALVGQKFSRGEADDDYTAPCDSKELRKQAGPY